MATTISHKHTVKVSALGTGNTAKTIGPDGSITLVLDNKTTASFWYTIDSGSRTEVASNGTSDDISNGTNDKVINIYDVATGGSAIITLTLTKTGGMGNNDNQ